MKISNFCTVYIGLAVQWKQKKMYTKLYSDWTASRLSDLQHILRYKFFLAVPDVLIHILWNFQKKKYFLVRSNEPLVNINFLGKILKILQNMDILRKKKTRFFIRWTASRLRQLQKMLSQNFV